MMRRSPGHLDLAAVGRRHVEHGWASLAWDGLAVLLVVVLGLGLRYGTNILQLSDVRDESLMKVPVDDLLQQGWSVETAIDYEEVKGPTFFWSYALLAELIGGEMNDLRLISVLFFIAGVVPLLLVARLVDLHGGARVVAAILYALLPYHAVLGQLLMSEASFVFFAMWMMLAFVWGFGAGPESERRLAGPLLFGVLLSVLLHHRPQAAALAGAAALVAFERDRLRSWPWWAACVVAGLSRLPLWARWGGLVSPEHQGHFALGLRLDSITYLLAAALPATAIFLWPMLVRRGPRPGAWCAVGCGMIGLALGMIAQPDRSGRDEHNLFMGPVNTMLQRLLPASPEALERTAVTASAQHVALALLAAVGGAAVGAMLVSAWRKPVTSADGVARRLAFWMLAAGIGLYGMTWGPVFDRYLAIWLVLLPVVWVRSIPRRGLVVQGMLLLAMLVVLARENLF